jgi:pyruvate dehydrogenase E2 component (dihydrolipoamide acetyltransferase)
MGKRVAGKGGVMIKEYKLPDLGEGIHEGEVVEVLVSVGDRVEDGQPIMVIETDKAASEVPSPVTGVVDEIRVKPGDTVKVGDVLMTFRVGGEAGERAEKVGTPPAEKKRVVAGPDEKSVIAEKLGETERKGERPDEEEKGTEALPQARGPVPASPSTRRLARDLDVDLRRVTPTGPSGQVTPDDVRSFAEKLKKPGEVPKKAPPEKVPEEMPMEEAMVALPPGSASLPDFAKWGPVEREPLRSVRKATARHMAISWSNIPHVTHTDIADITELEEFRSKHKADIEHQGGALSLTVFALKAAAAALRAYPRFNSSLDTERSEIVLKRYIHIGVAADTDRGLIVPVIRDVDRKSITELARELEGLVRRAREGKTERDELVGGTFTITNIGSLGGTGFAPIINYPQVAILGLAQARLQPVVRTGPEKDEIVPRLMLPLILGFDHRVVDGADAARFMNVIVEVLEKIENLLMLA